MSYAEERRRAPRVRTAIPARITAQGLHFNAQVCDLSRIGTRIRIPMSELGLGERCDMGDVCEAVAIKLGNRVVATLNPEVLGMLVQRVLRIVRIGRPKNQPAFVDLGCTLRSPLFDEEVDALGVELPERQLPTGVREARHAFDDLNRRRRASAGADLPRTNAIAYLSPAKGRRGVPMRATDVACTPTGVVLRFGNRRGHALGVQDRDPSATFNRLVHQYGLDPSLFIVENHRPVWSGPARLRAVEIDEERDEAFVELEARTE